MKELRNHVKFAPLLNPTKTGPDMVGKYVPLKPPIPIEWHKNPMYKTPTFFWEGGS